MQAQDTIRLGLTLGFLDESPELKSPDRPCALASPSHYKTVRALLFSGISVIPEILFSR